MIVIRQLMWDVANVAHIALHEVTPGEVEEVCHGRYVVREGYRERLVLLGPTDADRMLAVVLSPKGRGVYYPVTSYPVGQRGRRIYEREQGGERHD